MDKLIAQQIVNLVNKQNRLHKKLTAESVLEHADQYYYITIGNKLIGCVKVVDVTWYLCELRHLSVIPEYQHRRIGKHLVTKAIETGKKHYKYVIQLTVREDNLSAISLFKKTGFKQTVNFVNRNNHKLMVMERLCV